MPHTTARIVGLIAAAQYAGRNDRTVRRWIDQGFLTPYRRAGERGLYVDLDEIDGLPDRYPTRVHSTYGNLGKDARAVVVLSSAPASPINATAPTPPAAQPPATADRIGPPR